MYDIPAGTLTEIVKRLKSFRLTNEYAESLADRSGRKRNRFEQNMSIIESLPQRLKLLFSEVDLISSPTGKALGGILVFSVNTVEEIELARHDFNLLPQIHGLRFPRLKNLNMSLDYNNNAIQFTAFLNLQPQLEAFQLEVDGEISPDLFDAIKANTSSNKMRTFELRGASMFTRFPALDSWTFIQGMTGLRRFSMQHADTSSSPELMTAILSYLPSTIERIGVSSLDSPNGTIPISALTGFPHLTYLDAQDCGIMKIDDALQSICRALTKLRVLYVGEHRGTSITDLGLTGESSSGTIPDSGISLNNLKGLQVLELYGCWEASEQGLIKAVRFLELRVMEIDRVIPDPVLLEIARNNPSLESVSRDVEGMVKDESLVFRNLLAVNPRLTRIKSFYVDGPGWSYYRGRAKCEVSHRPSYGVLSRLSDKSIMRRAFSTMKIAIGSGDPFIPAVIYSCNLSEQ